MPKLSKTKDTLRSAAKVKPVTKTIAKKPKSVGPKKILRENDMRLKANRDKKKQSDAG